MGIFSSCLAKEEHYGGNVIVMRHLPLCGNAEVEENRGVQEIEKPSERHRMGSTAQRAGFSWEDSTPVCTG